MGSALFCLPLRLVLTIVREEYETQGTETYAYLDDITITADEISLGTVGVVPFLERELTAKDIHLTPGKTVALAPKGHVPTPEEISLLAGVDVRIADEGGQRWLGYPLALTSSRYRTHRDSARWGGGTTRADAATNAG